MPRMGDGGGIKVSQGDTQIATTLYSLLSCLSYDMLYTNQNGMSSEHDDCKHQTISKMEEIL